MIKKKTKNKKHTCNYLQWHARLCRRQTNQRKEKVNDLFSIFLQVYLFLLVFLCIFNYYLLCLACNNKHLITKKIAGRQKNENKHHAFKGEEWSQKKNKQTGNIQECVHQTEVHVVFFHSLFFHILFCFACYTCI